MEVESFSPSPQKQLRQAEVGHKSESPVAGNSPQSPLDIVKPPGDGKFWSWSTFTKRAKAVLLEDGIDPLNQDDGTESAQASKAASQSSSPTNQSSNPKQSTESSPRKGADGPTLQKGLDAIASSLSLLGDTLGTAIEEGLTLVESKANEILTPEPRIAALRRSNPLWKKSTSISPRMSMRNSVDKSHGSTTPEGTGLAGDIQLKASRDVAMAMASKAKMLLRELKTVKGDLTFLRDRCSQLEEENRRLRESVVKGTRPDEDDLVRLQLETLLAEKQRLQQENANYARENQMLHEVVEYHQIEFNEDEMSADGQEVGLDDNDDEVDQMVDLGLAQPEVLSKSSRPGKSLLSS